MNNKAFVDLRKRLNKTQKQMAQLLGLSTKAIHSYEQGWRSIPTHVERQALFLITRVRGKTDKPNNCWTINNCPPERKKQCPAWEFQAGEFCWFINGTICHGVAQKNWDEKMKVCRACKVLATRLELLHL